MYVLPGAAAALAQPSPACREFQSEISAVFEDYKLEAARRLKGRPPRESDMTALRAAALKGDKRATIALVGASLLERPDIERFIPLFLVRQICALSDRTDLSLHALSCGYLMSLNPHGHTLERDKLISRHFEMAVTRAKSAADGPENERLAAVEKRIALREACLQERRERPAPP